MKTKALLSKMMLLLAVMFAGAGTAWAQDVTYEFSSFTSAQDVTLKADNDNLTITLAKGSGSSNPAWVASVSEARVYAKGSLSVASTSKKIAKIAYTYTINANNKGNAPTIDGVKGSTDDGTWDATNKTWTGSDNTVTMSTSGSAGNVGFTKIEVWYESTSTKTKIATINGISPVTVNVEDDGSFVLDATFPDGLTADEDYEVTWATSNEDILAVDKSTGEYLAYAKGTVTITVNVEALDEDTYDNVSKTFEVKVVDPNANDGLSEAKAFTVAEAIEAIDEGVDASTIYYVKGIISNVEKYNSSYNSINYWISDDGQTKQFECYSGKGLNGADFTSIDDLEVGTEVIVKGKLTKYGSTYEFNSGNEIVSMTVDERKDAELKFSPATLPAMIAGEDETELTLTTDFDGTITATSSDDEIATITANGTNAWTIKAIAKGSVTFTFTGEATENFKAVNTTLSLTVSANTTYTLNSTVTLPSSGEWPSLSYGTNTEYAVDGITFVATDVMKNSGLQFKKSTGILTSPVIKSEHGYSVIVITSSSAGTGTLTLQIGNEEATSISSKTSGMASTTSPAAAFTIKNSSSNACNIDKIIIMPNLYVASYGWATHITPTGVTFKEGDAYVVTEASVANGLQVEAVTSVPANTPVLLKGEGVKYFTIATSATAPETNLLSIGTGAAVDGKYPYVLAKDGEANACFKQWTGEASVLKDRVVLLLDEAVATARAKFVLGNAEATGIDAVESNEQKAEGVYNLNGQRISQPAKGLYIVNGKKVFMNK